MGYLSGAFRRPPAYSGMSALTLPPLPRPAQSVVCTAAYILGEYGRLIKAEVSPPEQFRLLNNLFPAASQAAKGLLMTAFIKIFLQQAPQDQNLKREVVGLFERFQKFMDAELQQRAAEYLVGRGRAPCGRGRGHL